MWKHLIVSIICIYCLCEAVPTVQAEINEIKVAFIRGHNLWLKIDGQEKQITKGEYITKPKWSHDGKWIAYAKGEEQNRLELYRVADGKKIVPFHAEATNYQWSPVENTIAFEFTGTLNIFDAEKKNATFENVSSGVGDYAWYPDGKKFLVSSTAQLLSTGWTGAQLYEVQSDAGMNPNKMKHLYSLPSMQEDFLAYVASNFKWSPNQKWIAFLAEPTASWSADSNTLCLLKADGSHFEKVDQMLLNGRWIQWAPSKNILAYIEGSGRVALENKHFKVKELPALQREKFTPKGYVDWDFTWHNDKLLTLSRAREMEWANEEEKRSLPSLYQVDIETDLQRKITIPPNKYGDYHPLYIKRNKQLTWVRSNRKTANMWLANRDGSKAKKWIGNIDVLGSYYEMWNWDDVVSIKEN
ncbi:translocation protein TolB [Bacillus pseudomycoides]|uniref:Translocation protein TolB n=1 Tax=Bacillus pseudomycoides TaxID=64104 RepID=A0AA91ZVA3_9BACI|nr:MULTISPECIES: PD40 domain-containing protein [Bacillus]PEB53440.1 translocation protein TolB [Bacillus sp. AFS098217]PED84549.1 translocation protein TolB [Bacillus pseudomycoides]PEU14839.1 translocation protein TolB [Bacillus sp. AFS019443]PEU19409.1 translocation protein TolB [Bacillus sp. AFS014408]PFW64511.1 translocation protein TolB [Bacillus sp. AFS075034]